VHGSTTDVALIANAIDNGPDGLLDLVDGRRGFQQVLVITAGDKITVPTWKARSSSSAPGPRLD
jgi:hypothetical protein